MTAHSCVRSEYGKLEWYGGSKISLPLFYTEPLFRSKQAYTRPQAQVQPRVVKRPVGVEGEDHDDDFTHVGKGGEAFGLHLQPRGWPGAICRYFSILRCGLHVEFFFLPQHIDRANQFEFCTISAFAHPNLITIDNATVASCTHG